MKLKPKKSTSSSYFLEGGVYEKSLICLQEQKHPNKLFDYEKRKKSFANSKAGLYTHDHSKNLNSKF